MNQVFHKLSGHSEQDMLQELERRGVFVDLDGAIGALYDHLDRTGAFDGDSALTSYLTKRLRLQAALLAEKRGFTGAAKTWREALGALRDQDANGDKAKVRDLARPSLASSTSDNALVPREPPESGGASSSAEAEPRATVTVTWSVADAEAILEGAELASEPTALGERVMQLLWDEIGDAFGPVYDACAQAGNRAIDDLYRCASQRLICEGRCQLLREHGIEVLPDIDQPGYFLWVDYRSIHPEGCDTSWPTREDAVDATWLRFGEEILPMEGESNLHQAVHQAVPHATPREGA